MDRPSVLTRMSVTELKTQLDRGDTLTVLDVREPGERHYCSISLPATARDLFIPLNELPVRLEEIRTVAQDSPLIIYCHHGVRSRHAAGWLAQQGMTRLVNLEGGIDAWSTDVDPEVPRY